MAPADTFGEVFLYQGEEYVFFAQDIERNIIYAGRILSEDHTNGLIKLFEGKVKSGADVSNNKVFSYVVLGTEEFQKRAVMCGSHELNSSGKYRHSLGEDDIEKIKEEIKDGPSPKALKDLVELLS